MNIGICDLRVKQVQSLFAAALFVGLSACSEGADGFSFASSGGASKSVQGPVIAHSRQATLANGTIKIKPPRGYCTDDTSLRNGLQGSSVMIASCAALNGKSAGDDAAVLSLSVSSKRSSDTRAPTADDLARAVAPLKVLGKDQKGTLALVHVASGGETVVKTADPKHWRAATTLDSRLILLSLYAPQGSALAGNAGAGLLTAMARGISATRGNFLGLNANKTNKAAPAEVQAEVAPTQATTPDAIGASQDKSKKGFSRLIGGLFNRS